ncbi:MAG: hypothetical protein PHF31_07510 [Methylobacter sp.]|nr:hypothetical protein [Methylobacter sp.]
MNSITGKSLLVSLVLLLNACAHYPQQHSYYPDTGSYGSGYTVMQRNYYGGTSGHYDNGYDWDRGNFPHHHHDQYNATPRRDNNYLRPQYQQDVRERYGYRPHDNRRDNNWGDHNFKHRLDNENNRHHGNHDGDNHNRRDHDQHFND